MNLCELKRGERAVVLKVELPPPIRERLCALRIYAGAKLVLLKTSLFRRTFVVQAGSSKVALRREIAAGVRVWRT